MPLLLENNTELVLNTTYYSYLELTNEPGNNRAGQGGGKQWWEGEWIIPGVTHYLPETPPEDVTPLRPKVEALKRQLAQTPDPSNKIRHQLAGLSRSVTYLERRAALLVEDATTERAVRSITERYRTLNAKMQALDRRIKAHAEHMAKLAREDEEFLVLMQTTLD